MLGRWKYFLKRTILVILAIDYHQLLSSKFGLLYYCSCFERGYLHNLDCLTLCKAITLEHAYEQKRFLSQIMKVQSKSSRLTRIIHRLMQKTDK